MAHVVILTTDKDGKVLLTKDDLQKMLDDAYNKGYSDGKSSSWYSTITTTPNSPVWYGTEVTCSSSSHTASKDNITLTI